MDEIGHDFIFSIKKKMMKNVDITDCILPALAIGASIIISTALFGTYILPKIRKKHPKED